MKKSVALLILVFIIDLFLAKVSLAATTTPTPSVSSDTTTTTNAAANPGPPLGIPCGDTVCLPGEQCIQYPGDIELHCVPADPTPPISPTATPYISVSPTVPPSPTPPIIPTPDMPSKCPVGTGVYPPNSTCYNDSVTTQKDATLYEKTCIYQPVVKYTDTRSYNSGPQPFSECGIGDGGPYGVGPGGDSEECDVALLVNTDVKQAELASYGPSIPAEEEFSIDFLAQNYLYNSLFDRPLDLSDTNREAYRTYWRLMPASNQANLRSFILNMANDNQIDNIKFDFTDTSGAKKTTSFKALFDELSKQVIVFLHFPFIRVGCLTSYPVCPEYAQATRELKADFGSNLEGPYNAFVPLDFNSVRSYILKKKDEVEEATYERYDYFNLPEYKLTNVSFESLPYVGAVYQGLLSPKFGMLPSLQPQWIIDKYASPSGISDYRIGNTPETLPEVAIAHQGFLERVAAEAQALISSPVGWIQDKIIGIFSGDKGLKEGYTEPKIDIYTNKERIDEVRQVYTNPVNCPLPVSYHIYSPKTVPKSIDDHHQVVTIKGKNLSWSYTPSCSNLGERCTTVGGIYTCVADTCTGSGRYIEGDQCCTPKWSVEATKNGKAFDVLNNPKQTDIQDVVADKSEYSFYSMILPDGKMKIPEAKIDAPNAQHLMLKTAPNGSGEVLNPNEPVNRISNLAQDSMHYLQNCWTIPGELQNSPRCSLALQPESTISACTGEAFKKLLGDSDPPKPSSKAESYFTSHIKARIEGSVLEAYTEAENQTGVPCEVLAGIHYEEGDNSPDQDLQSGAPLAGRTLTESAIQAAEELKGKAGGEITSLDQLIKAMSYYNGGGNANCQASGSYNCPVATTNQCGYTVACSSNPQACSCAAPEPGSCRSLCTQGFPYQFSYNYCPPSSIGYDDPYVVNWWQSPQHDTMYLLYMYDCTKTRPQVHSRPGSLTVALSLYFTNSASVGTAGSGTP